ncbi:BAX inhibitor (BI)-1/YccA family protein [Hyphomicrobium methylovorum]|uniref:Bax inhibitor-1/YccA family protein n=1 Tax=Hyphomicrobium methylovorum TaxID=84 RepID=UPI0015E7A17B|nr:Bax inhibitor-1/YccA family protein [Hyphomicrobium methylovorum]MBA2126114.1 BAX inhibitor (BI)-1/YccA family protein [Hyphomicrobium methylovorum]
MAEVFTRPTGPLGGARTSGAIDQGLRSFMLGTYNYMALGVAGTAVVVMLLMANPAVMQAIAVGPMKWVLFAAIFGLGWFAPRLFFSGSAAVAHGAYWLYCALWGALMAPMISLFVSQGLAGLVGQAFFIAAATFAATSLIGYTTKKDMTGWSGFLSMASIGMIIVMLVSFFFVTDPGTSKTVSLLISSVVVLLFSVITAFETQAIKSMYIENAQYGGEAQLKRSSIFGAFMLYGSFVTLFIHILNILGIMNSND